MIALTVINIAAAQVNAGNHVASPASASASHLQDLEVRLEQEQDASLKRAMEQENAGFKTMIEQSAAREAQLRAQEADAATVVQTEQNKWQDLSDQLSTLSQSLGSTVSPSEN